MDDGEKSAAFAPLLLVARVAQTSYLNGDAIPNKHPRLVLPLSTHTHT